MSEAVIEKPPAPRLTAMDRLKRNPVVLKELRARMRGSRAFILLTVYVLLLSMMVGFVYLAFTSSTQSANSVSQRQVFGKTIFGMVVWVQLMVVSFVSPALTAGSISSERERQTYDLLRTTLLPARALVLGKFLSGLTFILLLLFAGLPIQSLAFLIGGVAPEEMTIGTLILVVTAITFCAVGIFCSSFLARTLASTVMAYAFAILLVFGLPMLALLLLTLFGAVLGNTMASGAPSALVEAALLLGGWLLVSVNPMGTAITSEIVLLEEQSAWLFTIPLSGGQSVTLPSPWIPYTFLYLMLSLALLFLSIQFVKRKER
jgi:ABC-2 type transport system permease protein